MRIPRVIPSSLAFALAFSCLTVMPGSPAHAESTTFTTTGVTHTWTVPTGVEVAQFIVNGGAGANGAGAGLGSGGAGGNGAAFAASLSVTPGETLDIGIGANASGKSGALSGLSHGRGGDGGDFMSPVAGGGGGATVVKAGASVLVVAGGGGGGGSGTAQSGDARGGDGGSGGISTSYDLPAPSPGGRGSAIGGSSFEGAGGTGAGGASGVGENGNFNFCGGGGGGGGVNGGAAGAAVFQFDPTHEAYGCGGGGGGSSAVASGRTLGTSVFSDSGLASSSGRVTINTIDFTTASLSPAIIGTPYVASLAASSSLVTGSTTSTIWSVTPALPTGLSLNTATGAITGTASVTSSVSHTFTVTTSDVGGVLARTSKALTLTVIGAPAITSMSPPGGAVAGGTSIMIDGTNLANASSVTFGGTAASITANTSTRVTVTQPAGYGTVAVAVTTPGGTATSSYTYASPTISSVAPPSGPANGGTSIQVNGTNLLYATAVSFGGVNGTITSTTDTRVTVIAPASSVSGAVDIVVSAQGGVQTTSAGSFTYTAVAPSTPGSVTAIAGDGAATVSFTAPANGGSAITSYQVTSSPGGITATGTTSPITVTGLTNGTAYTFTVTATNAVGTSSASSASSAVTPAASGGGGGGTPSPDPTPTVLPSPAPSASASTTSTTSTTSTAVSTPARTKQVATVPGLRLPRSIKPRGTTVLVPSTLRTADGVRVRARATIAFMSPRSLGDGSRSNMSARVVYGPRGRVAIVTDGTRPLRVTLTLTAPGTSTSLPLLQVNRWSVPRAAR